MKEGRFNSKEAEGSILENASMGNFMIAYLIQERGDLLSAIKDLSDLCRVQGKILPVSLDDSDLELPYSDGSREIREDKIDTREADGFPTILSLSSPAVILPEAAEAVRRADLIVFCPGDQLTSIIPNLLEVSLCAHLNS